MNVKNPGLRPPNILVVDDNVTNLQLLSEMLKERGYKIRPVPSGKLALQAATSQPPDLVLLDINMPEIDGYDVCKLFKASDLLREIPIIFLSARNEMFDKVRAFEVGGADYVTKPYEVEELLARVTTHLKLNTLKSELREYNQNLQMMVKEQVKEISSAQTAIISAMAKLAEFRDEDTGNHIMRVQYYSAALARHLAKQGTYGFNIDDNFVETIFQASALHDIGKICIPDAILNKMGDLTDAEFKEIKNHSEKGAEALSTIYRKYPNTLVKMGMEIARSHHERWDGSGYPHGLKGEDIPLSARIVCLADQYDALRTARPYKLAFDAKKTYEIITVGDGRTSPEHFDPRILEAFKEVTPEFLAIFKDFP
jgi:putative two-component system response regulator